MAYLSWFALARFANWYHFGMPNKGVSTFGTTEGNDRVGAYDTRNFPQRPGDKSNPALLPERRNAGARYFIPSDDEWYKAAYFDPAIKGPRQYWDYPTRSFFPPVLKGPGSANYQIGDNLSEGPPHYISVAAAYADSPSSFGTLQQGGNLWEWTENWKSKGEGGCWRCSEWTRGLRGGSFNYTFRGLNADNIDPGSPEQAYFVYGGRLARITAPGGWQKPNGTGQALRLLKQRINNHGLQWASVAATFGLLFGALAGGAGAWWISRRARRIKS